MLRTRPIAMILLALCPMALSPEALSANGGSFFDFDRTYYVPGEVITAQTSFATDVKRSGRIGDGPYYAYLLPSDRWIQPPRVPEYAIPIGRITITTTAGSAPVARITFTVPQTEPGPYTVAFCNLPCRQATLGDLAGGFFSISPTKDEALRRELSDQLNGRLAQARRNLAGRLRRVERAQRSFASEVEVQRLRERVAELEGRLASMQRAQRTEPPDSSATGWSIAGLLLVTVVLLLVRNPRSQRRPMSRAPRSSGRGGAIPMVSGGADGLSEGGDDSDRVPETADL